MMMAVEGMISVMVMIDDNNDDDNDSNDNDDCYRFCRNVKQLDSIDKGKE